MLERTLLGQVSGWGERPWPVSYGNWPFSGHPVWPHGYGSTAWWVPAVRFGEVIQWRWVQPKPWPEGHGSA
jgi:hypothetical protein